MMEKHYLVKFISACDFHDFHGTLELLIKSEARKFFEKAREFLGSFKGFEGFLK